MSPKTSIRVTAGLLLLLALSARLAAQTRLYVQEADDKFHAVFKVSGGQPFIMENGQLVLAKGQRFALKKVDEFLPAFVTIRDMEAGSSSLVMATTETHLNNQFHFGAKFESAEPLEDVFLVLELEISNVGKRIFVYEVGQLKAHTPKPMSVEMALGQYLGAGQLNVHLFVGGTEVFQSEQPAAYRAEMLDRMVARRIAGVQQANPRPLLGATPNYPAALRKTGLKGEAVVTVRVSSAGIVLDPAVERASEPAFGEEALKAVRLWRFVPRVVEGRPIEAKVSIPFAFDPPKEDAGKS